MKKLLLPFLFFPLLMYSQNYVDLIKIGYGQTFNNNFEATDESTRVQNFDADLTFPVVLNKDNALITGVVYSRNQLELFPNAPKTSLHSTTLKLGLATTYNDTWSSTLVLLPKLASDYVEISSDDFYIGGFALLKKKKNENLIYRLGIYGSTEAFGFFTTPIFGWYYISPNSKFEMDVSLPISADINYTFGATTLGVDYYGIGRSFRITENNADFYADVASLEFASYFQYNAFEKSVLLRTKFGYSSNNYEVYPNGQKIDLGLSAFAFGDDRTQLNPRLRGSFFVRFEALYRFDLSANATSARTLEQGM